MELYDALESNGSYSKDEIAKRMDKYRDKLMQVHITFPHNGQVQTQIILDYLILLLINTYC